MFGPRRTLHLAMTLELPPLQTVDVDGPIAYREWEGPSETTFVLLHGLGGSHLSWLQVAPGLAGLGRVLAPDLPGFGRTPRAGRATRLMDLRRWLAGFLGETTEGAVVLAGNSMGGGVAVLEGAMDPDRVAGIILTSSIYPYTRGGWPHPLVLASFAAYDVPKLGETLVKTRRAAVDPETFVRLGLRMLTVDPSAVPEDLIELNATLVADLRNEPEATGAFLDAARSINAYVRTPGVGHRAMSNVRCPVLVVHGRRDRFVPVTYAEAALVRYPSWRGRLLAGVGHVPQMEAPGRWLGEVADWYAATLR
jgi:pimeloyl-ACP methyl ester carboxylesterase